MEEWERNKRQSKMLSRRVFGSLLDATTRVSPEEMLETEVGRIWQSWWTDGHWGGWMENVVCPLCAVIFSWGTCFKPVCCCFW